MVVQILPSDLLSNVEGQVNATILLV